MNKLSIPVVGLCFGLALVACGPANDEIPTESSLAATSAGNRLLSTVLTKITSNKTFHQKFCRKANLFNRTFSVRSLGGVACVSEEVAAMAEIACTDSNLDDYLASACHEIAVETLGERDPVDVLAESIRAGTRRSREFMCTKTGILPPTLASIANANCPSASSGPAPAVTDTAPGEGLTEEEEEGN